MRESLATELVALEKHYRVKELAELWKLSQNSIIKMFTDEEGVLRLESGSGKRRYATLSIPESVASRVHERRSKQPLKAELPSSRPLRVIRFRDFHRGVSKQPRNVFKRNALCEQIDGERVA